jgi:Tfp pilus assembly protein PilV
MIRTFFSGRSRAPTRPLRRSHPPLRSAPLGGEAGDTLIEVLISALVIVLVVVATLTALNNANGATSLDRDRSQADALAQQDEEELRSQPVAKLSELSKTHEVLLREVTTGGTNFTIKSTAQYISDKTATTSCTSTTPNADYIETTSTVTWVSLKEGKPVVESGIISPPAGSALIVQVTGAAGEAVSGMSVEATGPTSISTTTSSDGCAILAVLPGEYKLNVSRTGYVDQNGYANSSEDSMSNTPVYVVAETTVKKSYEFAPAGELSVSFENPSTKAAIQGDTALAFNTSMTSPSFTAFGELGKPETTIATTAKKLFPFSSPYTAYAGTCPADAPTANGQSANPAPILVPAGSRASITVPLPPINISVRSGTQAGTGKEGSLLSGAEGTIVDTGCESEGIKSKRSFKTNSEGKVPYPGLPYGTYSLCVTATISGKHRKSTTEVVNDLTTGPPATTIYLGAGKEESSCP